MKSVWQENNNPQYNSLEGNITADVLIIGGGIAGILCAAALKENDIDCVLLEKERILNGNTGNTTAKITQNSRKTSIPLYRCLRYRKKKRIFGPPPLIRRYIPRRILS